MGHPEEQRRRRNPQRGPSSLRSLGMTTFKAKAKEKEKSRSLVAALARDDNV
jgi:hypothetical protein